MQRTQWLLLLTLQLPEGDPIRTQAVEALTTRLAAALQAELDEKDSEEISGG